MELKWSIIVFGGALLSLCCCLNWMAGGTFTQDEFATLRGKVDAINKNSNPDTFSLSAFSMSNELNALWAPAWNVVFANHAEMKNYDVVLYGYGFNNRWFWLNGFLLSNNYYLSIIIWKDYNCVTWYTLN